MTTWNSSGWANEHEQAEHMDNTEWENEKPKAVQKSEPHTTQEELPGGKAMLPHLVLSPEI